MSQIIGRLVGPPIRAAQLTVLVSAASVALAACGGGGDKTGDDGGSPTAPGAATGTNAAFAGGWSGTTAQGKPLSLLVQSEGVTLVMVGWRTTGATCNSDITQFMSRIPASTAFPLSAGTFTGSVTSTTLGTTSLTGTLQSSGSAAGTLAVNDTRCQGTTNTTWTATRASAAEVNVTGTWNATFASSLVTRINGTLTLAQSGTAITGTYNIPGNGAMGTFVGTVSGRTATFTLTQTTPGCSGTFSGHAVVMPSPELLVYYYSGTDCLGTHTNGNGSAAR